MGKYIMAGLLALLLTACATSEQKANNYQAYLNTVQSIETAKAIAETQKSESDYDRMLSRCTTDSCVSSVASYKAIADITRSLGNGGSDITRVAAPQREPSVSEQALAWAGVLIPGITTYTSITESNKTARNANDNSTEVLNGQAAAWSSTVRSVADTPSIVVGGNYGNTTTNTAGANLVSGDGNTIGDRNGNNGRQDSPGAYDYSGSCRDGDANCPSNAVPTP